jgi:hypothetical protein
MFINMIPKKPCWLAKHTIVDSHTVIGLTTRIPLSGFVLAPEGLSFFG